MLLVSRGSTTMSCWRVCRWHGVSPTLSKKKCMLELWTVSRVSSGSCSCVQSSLAAELVHPVPEVCDRGEADTEATRARGTTGEGGKERGNAVAGGGGGEQRYGGVWSRTHSVLNGCRSGVSVRFEVEFEVEGSFHFGIDPQVVDDFLSAAAAELGSPVSAKKAAEAGPASPTAVWCGVEFHTVQKTMRVSDAHLQRARAEVLELLQCERHSVQRLREIAGHLEFVASVYPLARSYTHRLWCAANQAVPSRTRVRLSKAAAADVVFWGAFLADLGPVQPMPQPERLTDLVVLGDASLQGFGFWTPRGRRGWHGTWPTGFQWRSGDMAVLELLTVLSALRTLEPEIRGTSVTVWTDNEAVYKCLKRMRGRKTRMRWLMRVVALFCSAAQVTIHPHWLSTDANKTADVLSRRTSKTAVMNATTLSSVSSVMAPSEVQGMTRLTRRLFHRMKRQRQGTCPQQHVTSC